MDWEEQDDERMPTSTPLDWEMLANNDGLLLAVNCTCPSVVLSILKRCLLAQLCPGPGMRKRPLEDAPDDGDDEDGEDLWAKQEGQDKTGFPEAEKDMAPSALIPQALKCMSKHAKKLASLVDRFHGHKQPLTDNQVKKLASNWQGQVRVLERRVMFSRAGWWACF